jgi:triacylglycerol lipase
LALAAALTGLAVAARLVARRRRRLRRRLERARWRAAPRHPVVLIHGLLGFDELALGPARPAYFRGLAERLRRLGVEVHRPHLRRGGGVEQRAQELIQRLEALGTKRVNLIAHSMGGLDARYALARLGLADRVASLITIGSPHRGTPLADLGAALCDALGLARLLGRLGLDLEALRDVTGERARRLNETARDARGVWYASVVGFAERGSLNPLLWPSHRLLLERAGPNDGVVPVASQAWGEVVAEVEADHWAQVGWSRRFDAAELFELLLRELRGRGL